MSDPYTESAIADIKASYPDLKMSDDDAKAFITKRASWFKGTIAVCVVYGVLALGMLLLALFSEQGKSALTDYLLTFTVTFILGMIIIIVLLVIQITTFKPFLSGLDTISSDVCPDYWVMKKTPKGDIDSLGLSKSDSFLMNYRCEPNPNIFEMEPVSGSINVYGHTVATESNIKRKFVRNNVAASTDTNSGDYKLLTNYAKDLGGINAVAGGAQSKLYCDRIYPNFLAAKELVEKEKYEKDGTNTDPYRPNQLRCAYAKTCKIPWTNVCPE